MCALCPVYMYARIQLGNSMQPSLALRQARMHQDSAAMRRHFLVPPYGMQILQRQVLATCNAWTVHQAFYRT